MLPSLALCLLGVAQVARAQPLYTCWAYEGFNQTNQQLCSGSDSCCAETATCESYRLCHNQGDPDDVFVRGPCMIESWDSVECPQICLYDETTGRFPRVVQCDDQSWCCSNLTGTAVIDDVADCCADGKGVFMNALGEVISSSTSIASPTGVGATTGATSLTSVPATTISTSTASSTSLPSASAINPSSSLSEGAEIGIGVGAGVGVCAVILAGIAYFLNRRRRRQQQLLSYEAVSPLDRSHRSDEKPQLAQTVTTATPLDVPQEMYAPQRRPVVEADGTSAASAWANRRKHGAHEMNAVVPPAELE